MAELIMLVGLPACGKTTWINKFKEDHPDLFDGDDPACVVISSDDIVEELAAAEGMTYSEGFHQFIGQATKMMKEKARAAFEAEKSIIWDQTNLTPKIRRKAITPALNKGYTCRAIVFSLLDSELLKRSEKRRAETGKNVPAWVVDNMANSYEAPTKEEGFGFISYIRK